MGRPAKYATEEERRKARCEAVKRYNDKKKPPKETTNVIEEPKIERKRGRPQMYFTSEEKRQANWEKSYAYYERNTQKVLAKRRLYYQENKVKILSKKNTKTAPKTFEECVYKLKNMWKTKQEKNKITILTLEYDELVGLNQEERKEAKQERINEWKDNYEEVKGFYDNDIPFSYEEFLETASQIKYVNDVWKDNPEKTDKQREYAKAERKRIDDIFLKGERKEEFWIYVIAYQYLNGIQPSEIEEGIMDINPILRLLKTD